MSSPNSAGVSEEKFAPWLRREALRALRHGAVVLVLGGILSWGLTRCSSVFASHWSDFNYQLSKVALDEHPLALARSFAMRLRDSEYGWKPLAPAAPFNVTAARWGLRQQFPEVAGVIDGIPQVPRGRMLQNNDSAKYEHRIAAYLERYRQIESGRFTTLYERNDLFSAPNANVQLGLFATKLFGLADAILYVIAIVFASGAAGAILFLTVLALAARPLRRSRRPARTWLKFIVWPILASTLVWGAIFFMAVAAAFFGGITPETSVLAFLTSLPFLSVLAKLPLRLAETLALKTPAKWDGVDRRGSRALPDPVTPTSQD